MTEPPHGEAQLSIVTSPMAGRGVRVRVTGEIDLATAPRLRAALLAVVTAPVRPGEVVVDLAEVTFIDATGVAALVESRTAARRVGTDLSVRNPHGMVLRVLDILGLTRTLHGTATSTAT